MLTLLDSETTIFPGSILAPSPLGNAWSAYCYTPPADSTYVVRDISLADGKGFGFTTGTFYATVPATDEENAAYAKDLIKAVYDLALGGTTWTASATVTSTVSCWSANPFLDRGIHTITTSLWTSDLRFQIDSTDTHFNILPSRTPVKRIVRTETWTVSLPPGNYVVIVTLNGERTMERRTPLLVLPPGA
jgi:hypothetical protein